MIESTDRQSTGVYRIVVCGIYHIFLRQSAIARSVQRSYHIHGVKPDRGRVRASARVSVTVRIHSLRGYKWVVSYTAKCSAERKYFGRQKPYFPRTRASLVILPTTLIANSTLTITLTIKLISRLSPAIILQL